MQPRRQLELLITEHCTLCEQALDLLLSLALPGWALVTRDIALDDALVEKFGEQIPVLRSGDAVLPWPFDQQDVADWVTTLPS